MSIFSGRCPSAQLKTTFIIVKYQAKQRQHLLLSKISKKKQKKTSLALPQVSLELAQLTSVWFLNLDLGLVLSLVLVLGFGFDLCLGVDLDLVWI